MAAPDIIRATNGQDFHTPRKSMEQRPPHLGYAGIIIGENGKANAALLNGQVHTFNNAPLEPSEIIPLFKEKLPKDNVLSRIVAVGIAGSNVESSRLTQEYWSKHAIVPIHLNGESEEMTPEDIALLVAQKFQPEAGVPESRLDEKRIVHPDLIVPLEKYEESDPKDTAMAKYYVDRINRKKAKTFAVSATEFGGGVAKKWHRVTSVMQQLKAKFGWGIQSSDKPERYDVTKEDIHNVLQLVEEPGRGLTPEKVENMREWGDQDWKLWEDEIRDSDVLIIHDPQPVVAGIIRHVREMEAHDREKGIDKHRFIIYRSHTQPDAEACDTSGTPQYETWNLLMEAGIGEADYVIAHPLSDSVPSNVNREKVGFAGATEDRFDGLNMQLPEEIMEASMHIVDDVLEHQRVELRDPKTKKLIRAVGMHQAPIDWDKGYTLDFARFDESKGKDQLIYHQLEYVKNELANGTNPRNIIPLVMAGNMATDDPSAAKVSIQLWDELQKPQFDGVREYFRLLIAPSNDFIANTLMKKSLVYTLNSTKEGYETVKKSALMAGKPTVITEVGGPKLQAKPVTFTEEGEMITEDRDAFLINPYDHRQAASYYSKLYNPQDRSLYNSMSEAAARHGKEPRDTTMQAVVTYLYLIDRATDGLPLPGNFAKIHDVAEKEYDEAMRLQAQLPQRADVFVLSQPATM